MTAWLIEMRVEETGQTFWWDGVAFTVNANWAIRFSRREDAERIIKAAFLRKECFASEHCWLS